MIPENCCRYVNARVRLPKCKYHIRCINQIIRQGVTCEHTDILLRLFIFTFQLNTHRCRHTATRSTAASASLSSIAFDVRHVWSRRRFHFRAMSNKTGKFITDVHRPLDVFRRSRDTIFISRWRFTKARNSRAYAFIIRDSSVRNDRLTTLWHSSECPLDCVGAFRSSMQRDTFTPQRTLSRSTILSRLCNITRATQFCRRNSLARSCPYSVLSAHTRSRRGINVTVMKMKSVWRSVFPFVVGLTCVA